jgi:polar amino acid transport system ATP-binding protein
VKIQNLHKRFGKSEVLRGMDLEVEKGEIICLIGPSGSGKSTFLRCINSLEQPTAGTVEVDGNVITDSHANLDKIRENIGMVFQQFNLFPHLTVIKNITLAPIS